MNFLLTILRKAFGVSVRVFEEIDSIRKMEMCHVGDGVRLYPTCRIENHQAQKDAITIESHSHILGQLRVFGHGGSISIGEYCYIGEDSRIWSAASIKIGSRVQISHGVNVHDNNSHSLSAASRYVHFKQILSSGHPKVLEDVPVAPIVIEDDVWIGFNSTILKGVTIGKGAVIGAATVVTKDVASYSIVAGNPAKVIGLARP